MTPLATLVSVALIFPGGTVNNNSIVVVIKYQTQVGQEVRARQEIAALVATVLSSEPECAGITILQHNDDASAIMLVERWADRETFLGPHMQKPHIQSFIQRGVEFLAGPPEIAFWHEVNEA